MVCVPNVQLLYDNKQIVCMSHACQVIYPGQDLINTRHGSLNRDCSCAPSPQTHVMHL